MLNHIYGRSFKPFLNWRVVLLVCSELMKNTRSEFVFTTAFIGIVAKEIKGGSEFLRGARYP